LPIELRKEDLSVAYVQAIAAIAGVSIFTTDRHDMGTDLEFRLVRELKTRSKKRGTQRNDTRGIPLNCQLKSTVITSSKVRINAASDIISYNLDAKSYDDLVDSDGGCVLVLLLLPENELNWLAQDEQKLTLSHCCYYWQPQATDTLTPNDETQTIKISMKQRFTPEILIALLHERQRK
jgi:Domain of unknown function (DUF4365)